jgi:hypothetical protein
VILPHKIRSNCLPNSAAGNPLLSALGRHFVAGQNNDSAQVIDVESEAERGPATGHDDESQEGNSSEVANELREDLRKLSAELKVLRDRNDLLAAALGACCLCWGQDPDCRFCRGRGRPGFAAPDEAHIGEFVLPAIHMLRVQRAKNNRSSPPANSVTRERAPDSNDRKNKRKETYMAIEAEAYETMEAFESESESESEAAEARPIRRPSGRPSFMPRAFGPTPPVSQGQLQAALSRVDGKIKTVSDVEATINSRVNSLSAATKKEVAERKKSIDTQVKDLNQKVQLLSILPLLVQPKTTTLTSGSDNGTQVLAPDDSKLNAILPLLLVGGLGGSGGLGPGGDGASSGGSSDSNFLLLALVLAFAGK